MMEQENVHRTEILFRFLSVYNPSYTYVPSFVSYLYLFVFENMVHLFLNYYQFFICNRRSESRRLTIILCWILKEHFYHFSFK